MDFISREALLKRFESIRDEHEINAISYNALYEVILRQPTIEAMQVVHGWIPCSERLPKSEDKYGWINCNVTVMRSHWPTSSYDFCDAPYDEYFVTGAMYDSSQKIWHLSCDVQLNALIDIEDLPLNSECVIAWMPLPEPYKEE